MCTIKSSKYILEERIELGIILYDGREWGCCVGKAQVGVVEVGREPVEADDQQPAVVRAPLRRLDAKPVENRGKIRLAPRGQRRLRASREGDTNK